MSHSPKSRQPGKSNKSLPDREACDSLRVQKLLGIIVAASIVLPLGLLRAHPIHWWFNYFCLHLKEDWRKRLFVSQACTLTFIPWRDEIFLHRGTPLGNLPHRRSVITLDASLTGWEGIWESRSEHMNVLKLRAVHLALKALLPFVFHKYVLIRMDSNSAVNHINHQGGVKSQRCLQVATDLLPWAWHGNTCPHNPHSR